MEKLKLFGRRIKELRKSKKMTQEQLSEILGLYQKQIGNIETGSYFTTMPNLEKLAEIFDVEIKDLFDFEHQKNKDEILNDIHKLLNTASEEQLKLIFRLVCSVLK
ncbi:MAG: hypothetical protein BHW55_05160 [Candidatus Melainabacteria bacterium 35_41]|jgi:transcriptional regulator, XRE family|nr:MAG: hypothetical protein BHW55_05160 [Candidatus Melainabacteria bacterium 35_41]